MCGQSVTGSQWYRLDVSAAGVQALCGSPGAEAGGSAALLLYDTPGSTVNAASAQNTKLFTAIHFQTATANTQPSH